MVGNDQADATADAATALYGTDMLNVASWFHDRAKAYVGFMKKVSQHIVEAYFIHRQLIDRIDASDPDPSVVDRGRAYVRLDYPAIGACRKFVPHASIANYESFRCANPRATHVEAFLKSLDVSPITGGQRPVSWVELYVLYVSHGYEILEVPDHLAFEQPSADKRITTFKNLCRAVVSRTLPEHGDAKLFYPAKRTRDTLLGVGILGQNPAVMFNVHVSEVGQLVIAQALINLSRNVSPRNVDHFLAHKRNLVPRVLTLNGNSGWVSTVKCLSPPNSVDDLWSPAPGLQEAGTATSVAFYKCKHRDRVEPSSCDSFLYSDLDRAVRCGNRRCLKLSKSREWSCACKGIWFTCAKHAKHAACGDLPTRGHEQATGRTVASESSGRRAPKVSASDFQTLLQDDLRRGEKRPRANSVITLGDFAEPPQRRPKLGAILSKRFGTSCSSN